jgi:hypothetical protein
MRINQVIPISINDATYQRASMYLCDSVVKKQSINHRVTENHL